MRRSPRAFDRDPFPDAPRILFVGRADSSHTRQWIELLDGARMNVRLYSVPNSFPPPADWQIPTYVASPRHAGGDSATRRFLVARQEYVARLQRVYGSVAAGGYRAYAQRWLQQVVAQWRPHVVHTLGLRTSGIYFHEAMRAHLPLDGATWVLQLWGGADLEVERPDPEYLARASEALRGADQIFDDNPEGIRYALSVGAEERQIAPIGCIPGVGGIDLAAARSVATEPPAERRMILWPKAYESPWTKSLPVIEALKIVWSRIGPVEVQLLSVCSETRPWLRGLPEEMLPHIHVREVLPHAEVMQLMGRARVMLAPSLIDGLPNVLLEAMATGALPIMSPLASIHSVAEPEVNALFARNLYPEEIADAIVRGMTDDALVTRVAAANAVRVADIADRSRIRGTVVDYYQSLARTGRPRVAVADRHS